MQTNFARAIARKLNEEKMTQADLARLSSLGQSTIARLTNENRRPDIDTLKALCGCWSDANSELGLLCEHLRDEIHRAGKLDGEITLRPTGQPQKNNGRIDENLDLIRSEALDHDDMESLIEDVATIIRRNRSRKNIKIAADPRGPWPVK